MALVHLIRAIRPGFREAAKRGPPMPAHCDRESPGGAWRGGAGRQARRGGSAGPGGAEQRQWRRGGAGLHFRRPANRVTVTEVRMAGES